MNNLNSKLEALLANKSNKLESLLSNQKISEILAATKLNEIIKKKEEPEKKTNVLVIVLAVIGAIAAVAAIAYAVYRYVTPDYMDDFDDDLDFDENMDKTADEEDIFEEPVVSTEE